MGWMLVTTAAWALAAASARAASIAYVTDMPVFSALAPCAQSALSYNILSQTYDKCPEAATDLQSCVCTKNNNFASISSKISLSISYSCGSSASDDQTSAQSVLSAYCNPSATISFPSPTAVSAYITDLPEFDYLAPCAQSALKYAVGTMTYYNCLSDAPELASCACNKNQNSLDVSRIINTSAKYSCSGHTADISSAQAMFAAYCAMNAGTTKLPLPSKPPGDMTYYITDLPQYSSLAPCAASGLSYAVQWQSASLCPGGPQALASCVCLKDGMTNEVLKTITSSVKYECSSTALEDVSSAVAIYNYYCSAAAGQVTAAGITNSVEQSYPASRATGSGAQQTGGSGSNNGNSNGNGGSSGGNGTSGSSQGGNTSSSGPSTGLIVGAVVGGIGGLALVGAIIFFIIRTVRKNRPDSLRIPDTAPGADDPPVPLVPYGKQELHSESLPAPPPPASPSPSTLKVAGAGASPNRASNVSPVSTAAFSPPPPSAPTTVVPGPFQPQLPGSGLYAPPPAHTSELYGQGAPSPHRPELAGQGAMFAPPPPQNMSELQGQGTQFHNAAPNRPELAGQFAYAPPQGLPQQGVPQQGGYSSPVPSPHQVQSGYPLPSPQPGYPQGPYAPPPQGYYAGTPPPQAAQGYGMAPPPQQGGMQASWQSGPVPGLHEMDGGGHGVAR
ncbi:hypothetical protein C8A05DRAFT_37015 [Staphylotrichum tortipilum]|uniref:Extracellular membrane protein CFEM domain-containing protein n=1 Tax=Staphylotrichum tortipilum TaxID=2831512 RepID=A0AAN6RQS5_9PEZI|nr:hypothetical protein C8A05DRAFT_37015 [Staphylotrichum longicolle]